MKKRLGHVAVSFVMTAGGLGMPAALGCNPPPPPPEPIHRNPPPPPPEPEPEPETGTSGGFATPPEPTGPAVAEPDEALPEAPETAQVYKRSDGRCFYHEDIDCPPPEEATCNPPPPIEVACPDDLE